MSLVETAQSYRRAGLCVLPAIAAEKRPALRQWKEYQHNIPAREDVEKWFAKAKAVCLVTGAASSNLEMLDFDMAGEMFEPWKHLVESEAPGLIEKLVIERSPSGGHHVAYRCSEVPGNLKLAQRTIVTPDDKSATICGKKYQPRKVGEHYEVIVTLIETRGTGGLFLCAPSPGYEREQGSLDKLTLISDAERNILIDAARVLNERVPEVARTDVIVDESGRPGDDFNARGDVPALLRQHGWTLAKPGANEYWRRPGKDECWSATLKDRVFYVFSSNAAPFEPDRAYSPFSVYVMLEHGGDYSKAAAALRAQGYGAEVPAAVRPSAAEVEFEPPIIEDRWPAPMASDAFIGLAGDVVATIEPYSEADRVALLVQFLAAFGNCIGRGAHWRVGGDEHHGNLFSVLVGKSAKGRKGTSWGEIRRLFLEVGGDWEAQRVKSGLSSAEGMIWQVRDALLGADKKTGDTIVTDPGVDDKRLMLLEPEFSQVLKQTERTGNTLSPVIRQAWERGNLESLTKNCPAKATGAHVSIIGHITNQELLRYLSATESANGFGNRFLWLCVKRSKLLPDGGQVPDTEMAIMRGQLRQAVEFAMGVERVIERDAEAAALWREVYAELSEERDGLAASLCGRAEAQTLRLAMLYALLDQQATIGLAHLKAALAVWRFCEASVSCVFGDSLGDPTADEILEYLRNAPAGLNRNDIRDLFSRHKSSAEIARALGVLLRAGKAAPVRRTTGGRPVETWLVGRGAASARRGE
jgi:hypothetical protein